MNSQLRVFETQFSKTYESVKVNTTRDYKESKYQFLGFRAKDVRKFKYEYYSNLSSDLKIQFLEILIKQSQISEVVSWALYRLEEFSVDELIKYKIIIISFANYIENWWHSDQLSLIYAKILDNHKLLFQSLQHFNKSQNPWLKRLSLTSIYHYSISRISPLPFEMSSPLVERLLLDEHYYVQKGVGWILRELSNLYYDKTLHFLRLHIKHIKAITFATSIEKLKDVHKNELKEIRKKEVSNRYKFHSHLNT